MNDLVLHSLAPSPNTMKARLALLLKQLPHRIVECDPADRAAVVALSGQPLTPVLEHDGRVVYDSHGILRYLDANWPNEPRLFRPTREGQQAIESWELAARTEFGEPLGIVFRQFFAGTADAAELAKANRLLSERTARIEDALAGREHLLPDGKISAADLTLAPRIAYGTLDPQKKHGHPIADFFAKHHRLDGAYPRTRAWIERVMAPLRANHR